MRVIVTGGCGFIGSHTVDLLVEEGHEVLIVDNLVSGTVENLNRNAHFVNMDIRHEDLIKVFSSFKPDVVYHLAAQTDVGKSILNPCRDAEHNIVGTISVLECCRKTGVRKIIYASSAAIYGKPTYLPIDEGHVCNPASCYGISKYTAEQYILLYSELYQLNYCILRYSNVYGKRQSAKGESGVISIFKKKFESNDVPVIYGNGEQTRDFIYVKDIASANLDVLEKGCNEVFNVSTGRAVSINDLYVEFCKLFKSDLAPKYEPPRMGDIEHSVLNNRKMTEKTGWKPQYTLETGLADYILG